MTHFTAFNVPQNNPLSVADEPPETPPSPQNDTLSGDSNSAGQPYVAGPRPQGILLVTSSCIPRLVIPSGTRNLTHDGEILRYAQGDNYKTLAGRPVPIAPFGLR